MTLLYVVAAGLAALLIVTLLLTAVPSREARGAALVAAITAVLVFGQNNAPLVLRTMAFLFGALIVIVGELRTSVRGRGTNVVWLAIAGWWLLVTVGIFLTGGYSLPRLASQVSLIVLVAWSLSRATRRDLTWLLSGVLVVATAETAVAAAEMIFGFTPMWGYGSGLKRSNPFFTTLDRTQGTFGHPIVLGFFQGLAFVLAWTNQLRLRPRLRLTLLAVFLVGILLSGTRSALLCAIVAVAVHIMWRRAIFGWLRGIVVLSLVSALVAITDPGVSRIVNEAIDSGSWFHRLGSLEALPALLGRAGWELWWGNGYGREVQLFNDGLIHLTYGLPVVDNLFVYVLGTTGLMGLLMLVALLAVVFLRAQRYVKATVAYVVAMFFSYDLTVWLSSGVLLFLVLSLGGSLSGGWSDGGKNAMQPQFAPHEETPTPVVSRV